MPNAGKVLSYGSGIYTSATSSKSNGYVAQLNKSGFKAMLLSDVVLGRVYKATQTNTTFTQVCLLSESGTDEPHAMSMVATSGIQRDCG